MNYILRLMDGNTCEEELVFESWEELCAHYEGLLEQEKEGENESNGIGSDQE